MATHDRVTLFINPVEKQFLRYTTLYKLYDTIYGNIIYSFITISRPASYFKIKQMCHVVECKGPGTKGEQITINKDQYDMRRDL